LAGGEKRDPLHMVDSLRHVDRVSASEWLCSCTLKCIKNRDEVLAFRYRIKTKNEAASHLSKARLARNCGVIRGKGRTPPKNLVGKPSQQKPPRLTQGRQKKRPTERWVAKGAFVENPVTFFYRSVWEGETEAAWEEAGQARKVQKTEADKNDLLLGTSRKNKRADEKQLRRSRATAKQISWWERGGARVGQHLRFDSQNNNIEVNRMHEKRGVST